jgi:transcriptional regulator with XRE-family HTH domain
MLNIKIMRKQIGMSQTELAEKLKVNQTAISQWERGVSLPACEKLPDIAEALNCTIDALFRAQESA